MIGVTRSAVHHWETKDEPGITLENMIKLSEAIEVSLAELLPPGTKQDMTVKDPTEILLLQRFRTLPPQQREVCLRLVVVMSGDHPQDNPPPR
jgi:predicted transcriptional regulator